MNIAEAKQEIKNTIMAYTRKTEDGSYQIPMVHQRPILLIGPPGIGKTAIMEQAAKECGVGLVSYTITHHTRQSAIGLPVIEKQQFGGREYTVTEYTMSEIIASVYRCMEKTGRKEGILFIDEINCVSETLAPTMLQFLQCKTFGSHQVPKGWIIVAAGNPPEYNRSVREFDIVTLDRVKKIEVQEDYGVWKKYALVQNIHPSILAYLDLKSEQFYRIETSGEGYFFVTARGWEDLSRMMWVYEDMKLEIAESLVCQYIQREETAKEFAGFYRLCLKYEDLYRLHKILEGSLSKEEESAAACKIKGAGFDEKSTVISLLIFAMQNHFQQYEPMKLRIQGIYEEARNLKIQWNNCEEAFVQSAVYAKLEERLTERKKAAEIKCKNGISSMEEEQKDQDVMHWLFELLLSMKEKGIQTREEAIEILRQCFLTEKEKQVELETRLKEMLEHSFRFAESAFSNGQEMAVFTSRFSESEWMLRFIAEHGCAAYEKAGERLLINEQEEELRRNLSELTKSLQAGE